MSCGIFSVNYDINVGVNCVRPLFGLLLTKELSGGHSPPLIGAKDVKGFALKTHQRLRLWKLRAFKKARAKLLSVLGKISN